MPAKPDQKLTPAQKAPELTDESGIGYICHHSTIGGEKKEPIRMDKC